MHSIAGRIDYRIMDPDWSTCSSGGHHCDHAPCSSRLLLTSARSWLRSVLVSRWFGVYGVEAAARSAPSISRLCSPERSTTRNS